MCQRITIGFGFTSDWLREWLDSILSQSLSVVITLVLVLRHMFENRSIIPSFMQQVTQGHSYWKIRNLQQNIRLMINFIYFRTGQQSV